MSNKIDKQNVQDIFELSMVQKGMLFHYLKDEIKSTYNAQLVFNIKGNLDVEVLQEALNNVQVNNEALRSVFRWKEVSKPLQIVLKKVSIQITYDDISDKNEGDRYEYIEKYGLKDQKKRFDLSQVPLRLNVIRESETSCMLFITNHHILYDGWSTGIILKELFVNYNNIVNGNSVIANQKVSYKKYILSKQKAKDTEREYKYWKEYLNEYQITSCFSKKDNENQTGISVEKKYIKLGIDSIKKLSKEEKITPAAIIYSVIGILLQKLTATSDIVFGTTVSGRDSDIEGVEDIVGNFINTIPLRIANKTNRSFVEVAKKVYEEGLARNQNVDTSYYEVKKLLELNQSEELFDVVVVVENYPLDEKAINGNSDFEITFKSVYENTGIPLVIAVFLKEELEIELIYQPSIIDKDEIDLFSVSLQRVFNQIQENPEIPIDSFRLLSKEEETWQIKTYNETVRELPKPETVLSLFEKQLKVFPDKKAVVFGYNSLTYRELGFVSGKIAVYLKQEKGIKKGELVGLMLERDFNLVPIILGVLKAGAAFVAIDPSYPIGRINTILELSKLSLLVIENEDINSSLNTTSSIISVKELMGSLHDIEDTLSQEIIYGDDLAYVIFTSGSTGVPKGIMAEHSNLLNYNYWAVEYYKVKEEELTFPLYSSISFDLTYTSIFTPLITGNTIIVYKDENNQLPFNEVLKDNRINILKLTPTHLKLIRDNDLFDPVKSTIRKLIVGGEELEHHLAQDILEKFNGDITIYNEYGPTETTIGCMVYEFNASLNTRSVPLGIPIYNTQIYILDPNMNPVPIGVKGEMYIAGAGLAKRGYLDRDDLTKKVFVENPFAHGKRMYKTGDYAKRVENNHIIFLGRIDDQVKISGYRIELQEIENTILIYPDIREAVITVKEKDNNKILVAYYIADTEIDTDALKKHLADKLPIYMLPMYYVELEVLPLTPNGKLDYKKLPEPKSLSNDNYQAPLTTIEKLLVKHWSNFLNIPIIGITDNYFLIGGDSIKSIQISSKMRADGYEVSVQDIFKYPTIKVLASVTKPLTKFIDQSPVVGDVLLSPIQQWYFNNSKIDQHHFNQSNFLAFGSRVTVEMVQEIFSTILTHHDALRMVFKKEKLYQQNEEIGKAVYIEEYDLTFTENHNEKILHHANDLQSQLDLTNGPLLKLGLFQTKTESRLLIVVHHLVIDGISWRILLEDIDALYRQSLDNIPAKLPLKTDSFKTWSKALKEYTNDENYKRSKLYWEAQLGKEISIIKRDFPNGLNIQKDNSSEILELSELGTIQLLTQAHVAYGTQINELLASAFLLAVNKNFGLNDISIDLEGHGREEIASGINIGRTIGWFTSIYPVLLEKGGEDISNIIRNVKETLRAVPNNGVDYLISQYTDELPLENKNNSSISFNYLGQFESTYDNFDVLEGSIGNEVSLNMEQYYDWNIIGWVSKEKLKLKLVYSTQQYKKETIVSFIEVFKESLKKVINHCCETTRAILTPSDLTYKEFPVNHLNTIQTNFEIEDIYPLTPTQEGMLFHSVLEPESKMYFDQKVLSLSGDLDIKTVEKSMTYLVKHHEVFRTIFLHKNLERPIQVVLKEEALSFIYKDIQEECEHLSTNEVVDLYIKEDMLKGFNLSEDTLMRVTLLKVKKEEYRLIWSNHHIVMDGWCTTILWKDFKDLYLGFNNNNPIKLAPTQKYSHYVDWLESIEKQKSKEYWTTYLDNYTNLASIPKKDVNSVSKIYNQRSSKIILDKENTYALQKVSKDNGVTLSTIFQTIWGVVLAKYNNVNDVVFGKVVSGRTPEIVGIENVVGLFINTLPVRIQYNEGDTLETLIKKSQTTALESEPHHYHSLLDIHELNKLGSGLFDHILVFENYPTSDSITGVDVSENGFLVTGVTVFEQTNYDLNIIIIPGEKVKIQIDYNQNVYNEASVSQILLHFKNVLGQLVLEKTTDVTNLQLISKNEENALQQKLNNTKIDYPKDLNLIDLFLKQVDENPKKVAVKFGDFTINYEELNKKSSQVASALIKLGVKSDKIVGLLMDRSIDTIIGMLGILKAGGAYLPIDINYPDDRKEFIIQNSGISLILTTSSLDNVNNLNGDFKLLNIEQTFDTIISDIELRTNNTGSPSDLCYVIYTSGTTGDPKGVMVEHRNVVRLFFNDEFQYDFGSSDVWTMFHSHCFDFSVWEIYGALLLGGKLIIIPQILARDTRAYLKILKNERVTILNQTPSAFYNLIEADFSYNKEKIDLRYVILGGELLSPRKLKEWKSKHPNTKIINMYGITETTVHSTYKEIKEFEIENNIYSIGKPIPTLSMYLFDKYQKLVPKGVVGELYVGGVGVTRGYLNNEELTNKKFITNPYNLEERLYKSGDLGRILESGELEYRGRIDNQVQLRGFRVELGEIENKLIYYEEIKEVSVLVKGEEENSYLVAYYVAKKEVDSKLLRRFLLNKLPDYMVPSYFLHLEKFPLTHNGKLNRKLLPSPNLKIITQELKPKNEIQRKLVSIWADLLGIEDEKIGINTAFFEIGGNSLKLMKMTDSINSIFDIEMTVAQVFAYPEITMLAQFISSQVNNEVELNGEEDAEDCLDVMNDTLDLLNNI